MIYSKLYRVTGASILAVGLAIAPASLGRVEAQATTTLPGATPETESDVVEPEATAPEEIETIETPPETPQPIGEPVQEAGEAFGETGAEAVEDLNPTDGPYDYEVAGNDFDWDWLGLLGLLGLFGLARGPRRRPIVEDPYRQPTATTPRDFR